MDKDKTERKSFRTYLSYLCMRAALWLDVDWVVFASTALVKQRVDHYLRQAEAGGWDYEEPEPEHITVTYH